MWTPISTAPIFNLGNILIETFTVFIGDSSHVFWEKNPNGNAKKWSINDKSHSTALHAGIRPSTISMQFSAISLPRLFLQTFQTSSKLLFLYNFSLYWSLGLRIVAVNPLLLLLLLFFSFFFFWKFLPSYGLTYFGKFLPQTGQPFAFFINRWAWYAVKQIFDLSIKAVCATFF